MKRIFTLTRILLIVATAGIIGTAILASRALQLDIQGYEGANHQTIYWNAAQLEVELARFIETLSRVSNGDETVDQAALSERFDILWSRAEVSRHGVVGEMLREYDNKIGAFPILMSKLRKWEDAILDIDPAAAETNRALIDEFDRMRPLTRELSLHILEQEQQHWGTVRDSFLSSSMFSSMAYNAAFVVAAFLVGVMYVEARRYQRTLRETEQLAKEARAADLAKSRFLSMMSHELRTPMNGMLGLIQLAKRAGSKEEQHRLIEQAERSGAQMTELLSDIMDFSELQTETLEIDRSAFQPKELSAAIESLVSASAERGGMPISVICVPGTPEWLMGDFARLRQALTHLASYFVEDVHVKEFHLSLSHDAGNLICQFELETDDDERSGWCPDIAPGADASMAAQFQASSLGTTVAHALVALMDGTIMLRRDMQNRLRLVITVPAEIVHPVRDCIRIEAGSGTTALVLRSALEQDGWRIWSPAQDASCVRAVLVELPVESESATLERIAEAHPGALMVGIGAPGEQSRFDVVCARATDLGGLRQALAGTPDMAMSG